MSTLISRKRNYYQSISYLPKDTYFPLYENYYHHNKRFKYSSDNSSFNITTLIPPSNISHQVEEVKKDVEMKDETPNSLNQQMKRFDLLNTMMISNALQNEKFLNKIIIDQYKNHLKEQHMRNTQMIID